MEDTETIILEVENVQNGTKVEDLPTTKTHAEEGLFNQNEFYISK
jgi:hypothetical protein